MRIGTTPPSVSTSPLRRCGTSPVIKTPPYTGPASLPTIVGSPTKMTTVFQYPDTSDSPVDAPIQTPFGTTRTLTCPDNMAYQAHSDGKYNLGSYRSVMCVHMMYTNL